jgi:hypothetical protein
MRPPGLEPERERVATHGAGAGAVGACSRRRLQRDRALAIRRPEVYGGGADDRVERQPVQAVERGNDMDVRRRRMLPLFPRTA